jgi:hypothetical protein
MSPSSPPTAGLLDEEETCELDEEDRAAIEEAERESARGEWVDAEEFFRSFIATERE